MELDLQILAGPSIVNRLQWLSIFLLRDRPTQNKVNINKKYTFTLLCLESKLHPLRRSEWRHLCANSLDFNIQTRITEFMSNFMPSVRDGIISLYRHNYYVSRKNI